MRTSILAVIMFACALPLGSAELLAADVPSGQSGNAALQYWKAFSLMPALDQDQEKRLAEWSTAPLDAKTRQLVESGQNSLMFLQRGAAIENCDWGLDYNDGVSMLLPHLPKARDLARLAALRARMNLADDHGKAARDDLAAMMRLARHIARDPVMIGALVSYVIEGMVVDVVAPHVLEMKGGYTRAIAMFDALPPRASMAQMIQIEKEMMASSVAGELRRAEKREPGSWKTVWGQMLSPETAQALPPAESLEEVLGSLDRLQPVYDEMVRIARLPKEQLDVQYPALKKKAEAENPLAAVMLPALNKFVAKEAQNRVRLEMLLAAIAVAEGGPERLKEIRDPFGDGPFGYRKLEQGFELSSKLIFEDKPVTLVVGQASAK